MDALTVKDLYKDMQRLVKEGKGDHIVFVTDDEEGNGYHALWFHAEEVSKMAEDCRDYVEGANYDLCILKGDKDKAIYLG